MHLHCENRIGILLCYQTAVKRVFLCTAEPDYLPPKVSLATEFTCKLRHSADGSGWVDTVTEPAKSVASIVWDSDVQYRAVKDSALQCREGQCSAVQCSAVQ